MDRECTADHWHTMGCTSPGYEAMTADRDRLAAEVAGLTAEVQEKQWLYAERATDLGETVRRLHRVEQERDRLRAALEQIVREDELSSFSYTQPLGAIARAALAAPAQEGQG